MQHASLIDAMCAAGLAPAKDLPAVGGGLLHALATCNSAVQQMTTGSSYGMQVSNGEEARALTRAAQKAVWQQDVKRAKFVSDIAGGAQ